MACTRRAPGRLPSVYARGTFPDLYRTARAGKGHPGVRPESSAMLPHDAACKLLFSFPAMVRDLLAGFFPREWVEELDLSILERWPESTVSDDLLQRHRDRMWRVRYRDRWLYVLVLLEFQSTVDHTMAVRILACTALLYQDLLRTSSDPLPPVLPIVVHHGRER